MSVEVHAEELRVETGVAREEWDSYVEAHPQAGMYHRWGWGKIIRDTYGHRSFYLAARSRNAIVGVLPLVEMDSRLFGHYLVSMPFSSYGGPLADSADVQQLLLAEAVKLGQQLRVRHIELREGGSGAGDWVESSHKVTMVVALPPTAEAMWQGLTSGLRNKLRNARKNNLRVEWSGLEAVERFYRVWSVNMRDLGTPPYPRTWFENICRQLPGEARFLTIWDAAEPVASGMVTSYRDTVEFPWSGSLSASRKKYSSLLMYWSVMEWALENGFRRVDLGRCNPGGGVYEFKRHFGCEEIPLHWHYWLSAGNSVPELRPDSPRYRLAVRAWRHLPVSVANRLGPLIVRSIP